MSRPEDVDCPTCGALAGYRCRRLVQDPRTHAVRPRTPDDPPAPAAEHPHRERERLARLAAVYPPLVDAHGGSQ